MSLVLEKSKTAKLVLEKQGLANPPIMRVAQVIDVSGSIQQLFYNGDIQESIDQTLGAGLRLDDNGEIDVYVFSSSAYKIGTATESDAGTFAKRQIMNNRNAPLWGGTSYAPAIELVEQDMFGPSSNAPAATSGGGFFKKLLFGEKAAAPAANPAQDLPVLGFFITDGQNGDEQATRAALRSSAKYPIYWQLMGVGDPRHFGFIKQMADEFDNVGFIQLTNLRITDEQMYSLLFTDEFVRWAKKFPPR